MCLPKRTVHMNGLLFTVQYRGNGSTKRSVCEGTVRANYPSWRAMAAALPFVRAVKQSVFVAANMLRFNTRPDLHKCCLWRKGRIYMVRARTHPDTLSLRQISIAPNHLIVRTNAILGEHDDFLLP